MKVKNVIFIAVLHYKGLQAIDRLIIRDSRKDMVNEIERIAVLNSDLFNIESIVEYDFKHKLTKYYAVKAFLSS